MAYDAALVASFRDQKIFVKQESIRGTLLFPAATDALYISGEGIQFPDQAPSFTDSPEISTSRGVMARTPDAYPPGTWGFGTLVRASGAAGTAPAEDVLLECWAGTKDIVASTSVTYSPLLSGKKTCSIWWKGTNYVFFARGATVNDLGIGITNKGYLEWKWAGQCAEIGRAGHATLGGDEAEGQTVISLTAGHAKRFSVGARIWNVTKDDDNSDAGYEITAVSVSGDTITIGTAVPAGGWATGDHIAGYLPAATPGTSYPLVAKNTTVELNDVASAVQNINLTMRDPIEYLQDEITATGFPETTAEGDRRIEGTMKLTLTAARMDLFYDGYDADATTKVEIFNNAAGAAGKRLKIEYPTAKLNVPKPTGDRPVQALDISYIALESSGEDSFSIIFT